MKTDGPEQNRAQHVFVLRIEVIPDLAVSVEHPASIDIDISPTELEKRGGVLVDLLEAVFLPVGGVVRELDVRLNH